ncbi:MAG TPA: hypothetical protein VLE73_03910 [Candidatus Saccharimonadales bacterium]|nr:hypothetical protein [Candidatus Saccharimonadales bacterium]
MNKDRFSGSSVVYRPASFYQVEKDRGTLLIGMDAKGSIVAASGEEKRIATYGLRTCTAVAIAAELPEGLRKGYVQHYNPLRGQVGACALANTAYSLRADGAFNVRAVVITPGEWMRNASGKMMLQPEDSSLVDLLTQTVQTSLGVEASPYPYFAEGGSARGYGYGTLMVECLADGALNILAETRRI